MEMTPSFPSQRKCVLTSSGNVFALAGGMRMSSALLHVAHSLSRKPNTPLLFICDLNSRETVKISCKGRIGRNGKESWETKLLRSGALVNFVNNFLFVKLLEASEQCRSDIYKSERRMLRKGISSREYCCILGQSHPQRCLRYNFSLYATALCHDIISVWFMTPI